VGGCALPARIVQRNWQEGTVIGLGMNGRGAVELIVAKAVLLLSYSLMESNVITEPLLTQSQFTILILMAFVTTLLTPISLRAIVPPLCAESDKDFCELWRSAQ
jgi:Kef-type K+ transport system membrane component KefB